MSIKDIISFHGRNSGMWSGKDYLRVINAKQAVRNDDTGLDESVTRRSVITIERGTGKGTVTLSPMKSLSLEDFSYPFQNTAKIRDALKLQVMPFTAAGGLEIFPVVLSKKGRGSEGIVWYVSPDELDVPVSLNAGKIWPAPLPFVSKLKDYGGNGVTMWTDEENICSILWHEYRPLMYRWKKLSGTASEERELSWYDSYCKARELDRGGDFSVNAMRLGEDESLSDIVSESVKICPWIADVNLSRSVLEGARDLERSVRLLAKVSIWLVIAGALVLSAEAVRWYQLDNQVQAVRTRSERFYRETFDPERTGRISNPVTLARDRIASLSGHADEGHPLDEVLADMGEVYKSLSSQSGNITIDIIRYNQEGLDCTGVAPDMTTVLNFRKAWEDRANLVQVDNTQFVSGIGYRFDLRIRW